MLYATRWTAPLPYIQWQLFHKIVAAWSGAKLAGGKPRTSQHGFFTLPFHLVGDLSSKLIKPHITYRSCKAVVFDHAFDVEGLKTNDGIFFDKSVTELMDSIGANVSGAAMKLC